MKEISSPEKLQDIIARLKRKGLTVGFVPTMGALHEGHLSLVRASNKECDVTVVSIFVNPTQFGPKEDLKRYPKPIKAPRKKLKAHKTDFLFRPAVKSMYPGSGSAFISVSNLLPARGLCGKFRPGHFDGVATVVAKLCHIVRPDHIYFGAKDYQQSVIVKKVLDDLNMNIRFHRCATIREKDGLAMSSRNAYLTQEERRSAVEISRTLFWMRGQIAAGRSNLLSIRREGLKRLRRVSRKIDYLEITDSETLEPLKKKQRKMAVLAACYVGKTRLIDNVIITA